MSTTEALQREAFDKLHPKNDEVPGVLRESFFFLFSKGWEAALAAAAPNPAAEPIGWFNPSTGGFVQTQHGWVRKDHFPYHTVPLYDRPAAPGAHPAPTEPELTDEERIQARLSMDDDWWPLRAAPMLNGLTASEPSYRDKAQKLLDAAHDFWQSSSPRVAVRWLSASDDALVIFTRGEYRETLMSNIDKLPGESVTWLIGEADEGPELRYGQRAASETAETASVAWVDECAANMNGHSFGPHGPNGELQCQWCGMEKGEVPAEPSASQPEAPAVLLPPAGAIEASEAIDVVLAEYDYPANSKNAARAGWTAAGRWLRSALQAVAQAEPQPLRKFVEHCLTLSGGMVSGNLLKFEAEKVLALATPPARDAGLSLDDLSAIEDMILAEDQCTPQHLAIHRKIRDLLNAAQEKRDREPT